jgi:hypothetical protein
VSKARAKKKRRQRARAAGGPPAAAKAPRAQNAGGTSTKAATAKAPRAQNAGGTSTKAATAKAPRGEGARAKAAAPAKASLGQRAAAMAAGAGKAPRGGGVPRPKPIWAPFPLTEIGIAAGIIIFGSGLESNNASTLSIGALVLAVVVGELCLREHFAGFRSHTLLLAALSVAVAHGVVVFAITDAWRGPLTLAVDLAAGATLAWWLRARFRHAREHHRPA